MGARAERNEFLLLHEFHNAKFIVPDKRTKSLPEDRVIVREDAEMDYENMPSTAIGKRKAAYAGGLVLEPKKGFYDKYVLLLDFNSLYPSIFQEYNICFTTIERSNQIYNEDNLPALPDKSVSMGVLPKVLGCLVSRRRQIKALMKQPNLTSHQLAEVMTTCLC